MQNDIKIMLAAFQLKMLAASNLFKGAELKSRFLLLAKNENVGKKQNFGNEAGARSLR